MIQKNSAQLATLSIDIQAIRVNGKRMSLAAFKQLQEGDYFDELKPNCKRWGMVRYKLDKDDGGDWVVYSRDGTLYRRKTPIDDWDARQVLRTEDGNYRVDGEDIPDYYTNGYRERQEKKVKGMEDYYYHSYQDAEITWEEFKEASRIEKEKIEQKWAIKRREKEQKEVHDKKLDEAKREVQRKDWKMASELPHLFIAV